jgi:hypothetical protein
MWKCVFDVATGKGIAFGRQVVLKKTASLHDIKNKERR